jgi:hypothetical protein
MYYAPSALRYRPSRQAEAGSDHLSDVLRQYTCIFVNLKVGSQDIKYDFFVIGIVVIMVMVIDLVSFIKIQEHGYSYHPRNLFDHNNMLDLLYIKLRNNLIRDGWRGIFPDARVTFFRPLR